MKDVLTTIAANGPMAEGVWCLRAPVPWTSFEPGQFVMLEVPGGEVFLRRPFGIVALEKGEAELCYKVVGRGTAALSRAPAGTSIRLLGPCGKGFLIPAGMKTAVLVAGGYGIGPLFGLAARLRASSVPVAAYYGGKGARHLLYLKELERIGAKLFLTTEDGSAGERGLVTDRLEREIDGIAGPALFACGPKGLLAATAKLGLSHGITTQVSMEAYMACGIGVCQGCVCRDARGEFVRTCREGPVFDAAELKWD